MEISYETKHRAQYYAVLNRRTFFSQHLTHILANKATRTWQVLGRISWGVNRKKSKQNLNEINTRGVGIGSASFENGFENSRKAIAPPALKNGNLRIYIIFWELFLNLRDSRCHGAWHRYMIGMTGKNGCVIQWINFWINLFMDHTNWKIAAK